MSNNDFGNVNRRVLDAVEVPRRRKTPRFPVAAPPGKVPVVNESPAVPSPEPEPETSNPGGTVQQAVAPTSPVGVSTDVDSGGDEAMLWLGVDETYSVADILGSGERAGGDVESEGDTEPSEPAEPPKPKPEPEPVVEAEESVRPHVSGVGETVQGPVGPRSIVSHVTVEDDGTVSGWEKDKSASAGRKTARRKVKTRIVITERDLEMIRFIGRYTYANSDQLAVLFGTSEKSIRNRLRKLLEHGYVYEESIIRGHVVWTPSLAGMKLVDLDFKVKPPGSIGISQVPHTLAIANLGVELERGGENVLQLPDFPTYNRYSIEGEPELGEIVVTEREVRSAQQRALALHRGDRRELAREPARLLREWEKEGDLSVPSPELVEGYEHLLIMYGGAGGVGQHIPDLVVVRPRNPQGEPESIGVEMELSIKPVAEWRRILGLYRHNEVYKKVVYFTHKKQIATSLTKIATEMGFAEGTFEVKQYKTRAGRLPFFG